MKRTVGIPVVFIIIILIAVGIFIKSKISNKYDYKIEEIMDYKYYIYRENEQFGIIDKEANKMVEAKYTDVIIPNPRKRYIHMLQW